MATTVSSGLGQLLQGMNQPTANYDFGFSGPGGTPNSAVADLLQYFPLYGGGSVYTPSQAQAPTNTGMGGWMNPRRWAKQNFRSFAGQYPGLSDQDLFNQVAGRGRAGGGLGGLSGGLGTGL